MDDWAGCLPWRSEKHIAVSLYCDVSKRAWRGVVLSHSGRIEARDFWRGESGSINFLEAKALFCALDAFKARIRDSQVDVHTDNKPLLGLWKNDGGSNSEINKVLTAVLLCSLEFNFQLRCSTPLRLDSIRISIALFLTKCGLASRRCLGHRIRSTATAAVIALAVVCPISRHVTPLICLASTSAQQSLVGENLMSFFPSCLFVRSSAFSLTNVFSFLLR